MWKYRRIEESTRRVWWRDEGRYDEDKIR